ncbi:MAG TPA: cupin domain-containing protein [Stellaceae bacterium]|jgi:gentisate 1,2-dioxygenase|nr:cupin domain-containing protein [Stellaceae bacterium]
MADGALADRIAAIRDVPNLDALYAQTDQLGIKPGWLGITQEATGTPKAQSAYMPAHWRYDLCKAALDAAGRLIDVALAERRNLVMRNPIPNNPFATSRTLVAAYQMILPGEKAPSHRHVAHALRVIIDAKGAYSTVDGEKTPMETGDVVLTPGWCWHEHGHDGDAPAYWLDALDAPLTRVLETTFYEEHPDRFAQNVRAVTTSPYRFTRDDIARRLDRATADNEGFHGPRITLDAPTMPTMLLTMERIEAGASTRRQRSSTNTIFCCVEGGGESVIGDQTFVWQRGDTFVAPCWTKFTHQATSDALLFAVSDEPLMRFARDYRFEAD